MRSYVLQTPRLGLRSWLPSDEAPFIEMGQDEAVMAHFPGLLSADDTLAMIQRLNNHFNTYGYTYFAVDELSSGNFIGFTGLANQTWESEFTPCVDIGWRLHRSSWGNGYATEAAEACLKAAGPQFGIQQVIAFATNTNLPSINVMKKIGMQQIGTVQHPHILNDDRFDHCVVYR
ncbi:MAG: GNAT family N-acetyltransferase [Bacteroidota bacterium]